VDNAVFVEYVSGARVAEMGVGPRTGTSSDGLTWSAPIAIGLRGTHPAFAIAPVGRAVRGRGTSRSLALCGSFQATETSSR
jgi:hypothetical protein